ncbi:cyclin-H isoform X7 [Myotis daubentonii]|uniref:cyclin-H isoform X7 n=1 Tax=Myotis daubentonii TaxID=98922 RepID=UPI002872D149|nr:cyclin-H isoform X7 [Myotis daubentonii]
MYHNSSQKRHWTFASEEQLARLRADANRKFKCKAVANGKGTACMYFKRFYLNNSVMEYHPRIIMLTCAFLACKVDEFNVSSLQFVGNLRESPLGQEKALEQILEYELLLIQQLNFHLIVHNPYRPFEGFLIDLKTRYPVLENPEILRKTADDFLNRVALTDAYLLYTPSQIALTAILSSASRAGITMESYLSESLMLKENRTCLSQLLDVMKSMRNLVKKYEPPRPEEVAVLKQKLERCHSAELALNVITKKRKGYEDDDYVSKKSKHEEVCSPKVTKLASKQGPHLFQIFLPSFRGFISSLTS